MNNPQLKEIKLTKIEQIPAEFVLYQNYPNPFNSSTEIKYGLPLKSKVELVVYNVLGQQIKKLISREQEPGTFQVRWDGTTQSGQQVASGIFY